MRGVLYALQWRVCAYCGRSLPGNDRGDVEHFRPKKAVHEAPEHGGYWWLAYRLENYVLSCGVCNSSRKGNKFPMRPRARHKTFDDAAELHREARLLWDAGADPLDAWVTIDLDDPLLAVVPQAGLTRTERRQVEGSIAFFRINLDQFLIRERLRVFDAAVMALDRGETDVVRDLAVRFRPHSIVARALLVEHAAVALPTPEREVEWLLGELLSELELLLAILEQDPDEARSKLEMQESKWMLAALLRDPHGNGPARVEALCEALGILAEVRGLSERFA